MLVPAVIDAVAAPGSWLDAWCLVLGAWCLVLNAWCLVLDLPCASKYKQDDALLANASSLKCWWRVKGGG